MGCSVNTKFKNISQPPTLYQKKSKVPVSTFIQQNHNHFSQIYRLGRIINTSTYGEVHLCYHRHLHHKRAVKIIHKNLMSNQSLRANLDNELQIIKSLDHPNIIRIYEFFEELNRLYIVMDYCKGGQLSTQLKLQKTFSEPAAAKIFTDLLRCLKYLHSNHIIHRDLKPENILFEEKHEATHIKIIDFASATFIDNRKLNQLIGTLNYSSPELLSGSYDEGCDLWSCGVILYVLLSGNQPFVGKSEIEVKQNILKVQFNLRDDIWENISSEAKSLISNLLCPEEFRISVAQALTHPWIIKYSHSEQVSSEVVSAALRNLKNFRSASFLQETVNAFITSQFISDTDTKELRDVFRRMDKDGDGRLSKEELILEYQKKMGENEARIEVERILNEVDADENGFIDYSEFLKGCLDRGKLLSIENLHLAFEMFDQDGNGEVSVSELKELIGGMSENKVWDEIFSEMDLNGESEINIEEFKKIVLKNGNFS